MLGSIPFVVGISISELDCGYQSEAGGQCGGSHSGGHNGGREENPAKKLHVREYIECCRNQNEV